jgi:hypothetical protein
LKLTEPPAHPTPPPGISCSQAAGRVVRVGSPKWNTLQAPPTRRRTSRRGARRPCASRSAAPGPRRHAGLAESPAVALGAVPAEASKGVEVGEPARGVDRHHGLRPASG